MRVISDPCGSGGYLKDSISTCEVCTGIGEHSIKQDDLRTLQLKGAQWIMVGYQARACGARHILYAPETLHFYHAANQMCIGEMGSKGTTCRVEQTDKRILPKGFTDLSPVSSI